MTRAVQRHTDDFEEYSKPPWPDILIQDGKMPGLPFRVFLLAFARTRSLELATASDREAAKAE